jgi:hypothetical protein
LICCHLEYIVFSRSICKWIVLRYTNWHSRYFHVNSIIFNREKTMRNISMTWKDNEKGENKCAISIDRLITAYRSIDRSIIDYRLIDRSIDYRFIDWSIDRLIIDWSVDYQLISWLSIDQLIIDWSIDWLIIDWSIDWLSIDRLIIDWSIDRLILGCNRPRPTWSIAQIIFVRSSAEFAKKSSKRIKITNSR